MDALLAAPDRKTALGQRDYALLLFLYNSGARASEAASLRVQDLYLHPDSMSHVELHGKGRKTRRCPLWPATATEMLAITRNRSPDDHVFLNRRRQDLTRYGIHRIIRLHARKAAALYPALAAKQISPHVIRHYAGCRTILGERRTDSPKPNYCGLRECFPAQPPGIVLVTDSYRARQSGDLLTVAWSLQPHGFAPRIYAVRALVTHVNNANAQIPTREDVPAG
jgi:hypothetical protein